MTDTERLDALQRWLDSAVLPCGTLTFAVPGLAAGHVRVGADLRENIDRARAYEQERGAALLAVRNGGR